MLQAIKRLSKYVWLINVEKISFMQSCDMEVIKATDCIIKVHITSGNIKWRSFALRFRAFNHKSTWQHEQTKGRMGKRGRIKRQGWSGGEENERQMANNVKWEIRVCDGYLVCWLLRRLPGNGARNGSLSGVQILTWPCVSLPGNGARNPSCYLLSTALVFPWRGKGDAAK